MNELSLRIDKIAGDGPHNPIVTIDQDLRI